MRRRLPAGPGSQSGAPTMPKCGLRCECYSRVVGYYRPTHNREGRPLWNRGKLEELRQRRPFRAPTIEESHGRTSAS